MRLWTLVFCFLEHLTRTLRTDETPTNSWFNLSSICASCSWVPSLSCWRLKDATSHLTQDSSRVSFQARSSSADPSSTAETESATTQLQRETEVEELEGTARHLYLYVESDIAKGHKPYATQAQEPQVSPASYSSISISTRGNDTSTPEKEYVV